MPSTRRLLLRRESLTELTPAELDGVAGASYTTSFESCPTWWCTPLIHAVQETVRRLSTAVNGCPL